MRSRLDFGAGKDRQLEKGKRVICEKYFLVFRHYIRPDMPTGRAGHLPSITYSSDRLAGYHLQNKKRQSTNSGVLRMRSLHITIKLESQHRRVVFPPSALAFVIHKMDIIFTNTSFLSDVFTEPDSELDQLLEAGRPQRNGGCGCTIA